MITWKEKSRGPETIPLWQCVVGQFYKDELGVLYYFGAHSETGIYALRLTGLGAPITISDPAQLAVGRVLATPVHGTLEF